MKKIALIIVVALTACALAQNWADFRTTDGKRVEPGAQATYRGTWTQLAAFTAGTVTPDASHRTYTTFDDDAQNRIVLCDSRWNRILIRALSTTAADTTTVDVFLMIGGTGDHFTRIGTLQFTTGTQPSGVSGSEFADAVTESNTDGSLRAWRTMSPTGYIAMAEVDIGPGDVLGFCPTTVTHNAVIEVCGY